MWFPQQMTEIELVIPDRYAVNVTTLLTKEGIFHQEDVSYMSVETNVSEEHDWRAKFTEYGNMERQLLATMKFLGIDEGTAPVGEMSMVTDPDEIRPLISYMDSEVGSVINEMGEVRKQIEKLQSYVDQLTPFTDIDLEFDKIRNRRYIYSLLGLMPAENIQRLKTSLTRIPFALFEMKPGQKQSVVLLLGLRQNKDVLRRAARSAYLNVLDLPDEYQGRPADIVASLQQKIQAYNQKQEDLNQEVARLREKHKDQFCSVLWRIRSSRMMAESMARYGKLRYTYLVVGWVPSSLVEKLEMMLKEISKEILMDTRIITRSSGKGDAPVALQNKGILGNFQSLVTTYGLPGYKELDPTILMAFTFPLLFGAMFGDVGHGAILALLGGLLISRKVKALSSMGGMGWIVLICGITSIFFGFLYGSVFGNEEVLKALWLHPIEHIMNIIVLTIGAGTVLLTLANVLGLVNAARKKHWGQFFFSGKGLAGLVLYWSLIALAIGVLVPTVNIPAFITLPLAAVSAIVVFLSELLERLIEHKKPLIEGGFGTFFIQSFFELFEILIGFLSNSLSYARVGAFAVAHAGLTSVIYILAEMIGTPNGIVYWIVLVLGNLFVVGFEGMIVAIQTLRLEYYEFFSKFFVGGGKQYLPLKITKTKQQGAN